MKIDCHSHSDASDGDYTVNQMLAAAIESGLEVFAITDHCELDCYEKDNLSVNVQKSVNAVTALKDGAPIKLLCGIELGQATQFPQKAKEVLSAYPFDMVIGSLHMIKGERDFYYLDYSNMTAEQIMKLLHRYFKELIELALFGGFDTLAHITYPFRYIIMAGKLSDKIPLNAFDKEAYEIFELLIKKGIALENNISSLIKDKEGYALCRHYLELYYKAGGRLVSVGTDAHAPQDVGRGIEDGYELMRELGFESTVYFENRKPVFCKL